MKEKELREALRLGIKMLIVQEVRLLRLERTFTPHFILDGMSQSIQEMKGRITKLARTSGYKERTALLKRMVRQAVDEEINRAIQLRKNKCLRCIHGRFYDEDGTAYVNLPIGTSRAQTLGCDKLRPNLKKSCRRFVETSSAISLNDYLNEMTFLYELREMFERFEEIWEDYLLI